jgi:hypothetical protein
MLFTMMMMMLLLISLLAAKWLLLCNIVKSTAPMDFLQILKSSAIFVGYLFALVRPLLEKINFKNW